MWRRRKDTFYDILGCSPYATMGEISSAYKRTAFLIHPDLSAKLDIPPAEWEKRLAWTKELNRAWEILKNPIRRAEYDLEIGLRPQSPLVKQVETLQKNLFAPARELKPFTPHFDWSNLRLARPRLITRLLNNLYGSRAGQWLLLLAFVGLIQLTGGFLAGLTFWQFTVIRGPLEILSLVFVALILARSGEPSPLFDALDLMVWLDHQVWQVSKHFLSRLAGQTGEVLATSAQTAAASVREAHRRAQVEEVEQTVSPSSYPPGQAPNGYQEDDKDFPESQDFIPLSKRPGRRPPY
jgi:hypothetical protein